MKIIVTGATGFIGRPLVKALSYAGHDIIPLGRRALPGGIVWSPRDNQLNPKNLEGAGAVIHLSGDSLASGRWTHEKKIQIHDSRINSTRLLCEALSKLSQKPTVFISASAVGFYGHRGEEVLDETSSPSSGFLSEVCQAWEAASGPAKNAGIRVVHARLGMVLGRGGGALKSLVPVFKLGLGGILGDGRQYMSWISLDDVIAILKLMVHNTSLVGPINVVSPYPVTNEEFTKTLGRLLHRPVKLRTPAWILKLALGKMAEEVLLASTRVKPATLLEIGYPFLFPNLEEALKICL